MTATISPPRTRTPARTPLTTRQRLSRADVRWSPYLYVSPFFVLFALVGLFPLGYTFVVSLNHWDLLSGPGKCRRHYLGLRRARRRVHGIRPAIQAYGTDAVPGVFDLACPLLPPPGVGDAGDHVGHHRGRRRHTRRPRYSPRDWPPVGVGSGHLLGRPKMNRHSVQPSSS